MAGTRWVAVTAACAVIVACTNGEDAAPTRTADATTDAATTVSASTTPATTDPTTSTPPPTPDTTTERAGSSASTTSTSPQDATRTPDDATRTPDGVVDDAEVIAREYFEALDRADYATAAKMLGEGGLSLSERPDLVPLGDVGESPAELEQLLAEWCERGARCSPVPLLDARADGRGRGAVITARWGAGPDLVSTVVSAERWEGLPAVTGLPPLVGVDALDRLAVLTGAQRLVASMPDGTVVAWDGGEVAEIPVAADAFPWSDGEFVYWQVAEQLDASSRTTSVAADLTGRVVCEAPGWIHRVRQRADGSYVASTERFEAITPDGGEQPVPNDAIDCATGEVQPIAERSFHREGGGRTQIDVGGRRFSMDYDAEGNGDVVNERGVSINGDDYAGFHTLSPDADRVAYGHYLDMGPHTTDLIKVRDTNDGSLLWETRLTRPFGALALTDDRLIAAVPPAEHEHDPWRTTETLAVYDLADGRLLVEIPSAITPLAVV